jgi:hypothetical protein
MSLATAIPIQTTARGLVHRLTFKNEDGTLRSISGATIEVVYRDPDGNEARESGVIVGDGTGGQATFTDTAGTHNAVVGWWRRWGTADFGGGNGPFPSTSVRYEVTAEGDAEA